MNEHIMICVSNPLHAAKLIQRGRMLATAMQGKATVLWLCPVAYDEMNYEQVQTRRLFESLCEQYDTPLIVRSCEGKRFTQSIAEVARSEGVTQIVIGQSCKSRIGLVFGTSAIDELIAVTDEVDVHVVHVVDQTERKGAVHEQGVPCSIESDDGGMRINLTPAPDATTSGIFFRRSTTDFDHGHCVIKKGGKLEVHEVLDGRITS